MKATTETADLFQEKANLPYELDKLKTMLLLYNPSGGVRPYLPKDVEPLRCFNCDDRGHLWENCKNECKYCAAQKWTHKGEKMCSNLKDWVWKERERMRCADESEFILRQYTFSYDFALKDPKFWIGIEFFLVRLNLRDYGLKNYYQGLRETRSNYPEGTDNLGRIGFEYGSKELKRLQDAMPSIGFSEVTKYQQSLCKAGKKICCVACRTAFRYDGCDACRK